VRFKGVTAASEVTGLALLSSAVSVPQESSSTGDRDVFSAFSPAAFITHPEKVFALLLTPVLLAFPIHLSLVPTSPSLSNPRGTSFALFWDFPPHLLLTWPPVLCTDLRLHGRQALLKRTASHTENQLVFPLRSNGPFSSTFAGEK